MEIISLTQALIQKASVTPRDEGCQELIASILEEHGFTVKLLPFGDVKNLWATHGSQGPLTVFAGHTDVVDPGNDDLWEHSPFSGHVEIGMLHGRGAADMKGALAAMVCAACQYVKQNPNHPGTIGFLITSDEEGKAENGTKKVIEYLLQEDIYIDYCIVGEASSSIKLGDQIRIGRRGSLHADILIKGKQGHVAYPELANNAIHETINKLRVILEEKWDDGNEYFPETTMQITSIKSGIADNVIPGECHIHINFRFSPESTVASLKQRCKALLNQVSINHDITWHLSGEPFLTKSGVLINTVKQVIFEHQGLTPHLSTGGGTSDGRFIAPTGAEVIELGPLNETIHKVNECVSIKDLEDLSKIYQEILNRLC